MTCSIWVGNTWYVHECMCCRLISSRCIHLSLSYFAPEIKYPVLALFLSKTPENLTAKPLIILQPIRSHGTCLLTAVSGEFVAFVVIETRLGKQTNITRISPCDMMWGATRSKGFSSKHRLFYLCLDYLKRRRIACPREKNIRIFEFYIKFCIRNRLGWNRRDYGTFFTIV